jgi:hypothetical protein
MAFRQGYAIAAGFDQALLDLVNVETFFVMPGKPMYVRGWANYDPGEERTLMNGLPSYAGDESVTWLAGAFSAALHNQWSVDYCDGGLGGLVTIATTLGDPEVYYRCNAVLRLPKLTQVQTVAKYIRDYPIRFVIEEVLGEI